MNISPKDHDYPQESETTIKLASGRYVDLAAPRLNDIHITDIAHALSHICRFGGHTAAFYSVAEHSLHVSAMLLCETGSSELALIGLLHDGAEAYIGDMVRPLKHQKGMAAYRDNEAAVEAVIAARFGLKSLSHPDVKTIDNEILSWEMAIFRDAMWRTPTDPVVVRTAFLERFQDLS